MDNLHEQKLDLVSILCAQDIHSNILVKCKNYPNDLTQYTNVSSINSKHCIICVSSSHNIVVWFIWNTVYLSSSLQFQWVYVSWVGYYRIGSQTSSLRVSWNGNIVTKTNWEKFIILVTLDWYKCTFTKCECRRNWRLWMSLSVYHLPSCIVQTTKFSANEIANVDYFIDH